MWLFRAISIQNGRHTSKFTSTQITHNRWIIYESFVANEMWFWMCELWQSFPSHLRLLAFSYANILCKCIHQISESSEQLTRLDSTMILSHLESPNGKFEFWSIFSFSHLNFSSLKSVEQTFINEGTIHFVEVDNSASLKCRWIKKHVYQNDNSAIPEEIIVKLKPKSFPNCFRNSNGCGSRRWNKSFLFISQFSSNFRSQISAENENNKSWITFYLHEN